MTVISLILPETYEPQINKALDVRADSRFPHYENSCNILGQLSAILTLNLELKFTTLKDFTLRHHRV